MSDQKRCANLDLPLSSNHKDIHVQHFMLDLTCHMDSRTFTGSVILLCTPMVPSTAQQCPSCSLMCGIHPEGLGCETDHMYSSPVKVPPPDVMPFQFIVDSSLLNVYSVDEVSIEDLEPYKCNHAYHNCLSGSVKTFCPELLKKCVDKSLRLPLKFLCDDNCIKIWKEGITCVHNFPSVVEIKYSTTPEGESLKWTSTQDGR